MTLGRTAMVEGLGWIATAVFVGSYFCARARTVIRVQMAGALVWTAYGILVGAPPVVAANLLVLAAAAWKSRRPAAVAALADGAGAGQSPGWSSAAPHHAARQPGREALPASPLRAE